MGISRELCLFSRKLGVPFMAAVDLNDFRPLWRNTGVGGYATLFRSIRGASPQRASRL